MKTLAQYTDWMKGIAARRPLRGKVVRDRQRSEQRYRLWRILWNPLGSGRAGSSERPALSTDYVYVMQFEGGKIVHMTKIWNAGLALKDLGWV